MSTILSSKEFNIKSHIHRGIHEAFLKLSAVSCTIEKTNQDDKKSNFLSSHQSFHTKLVVFDVASIWLSFQVSQSHTIVTFLWHYETYFLHFNKLERRKWNKCRRKCTRGTTYRTVFFKYMIELSDLFSNVWCTKLSFILDQWITCISF